MKNSALSKEKQAKRALTIFFSVLCVFYVMPVLLVLLNSFKVNTFVKTDTFGWPHGESFAGWSNFVKGMTFGNYPFWKSALYSVIITVLSTALILLFTSMAAWYISRVNSVLCRVIYYLCVFSMVVPFQMVMFTLSKTADTLKLNTPWTIPVIYLGFGAGLAVFMFTGFVKAIPLDIEEAAAIDGCGPIRTFFQVSFPMAMPGIMVATLYTFLGSMEEAQGTLLVGLARIKTMPVEMYGIILDYPGQAGAVFAILLMIPAAVMIFAMKKYIGPEAIAGGFKMK